MALDLFLLREFLADLAIEAGLVDPLPSMKWEPLTGRQKLGPCGGFLFLLAVAGLCVWAGIAVWPDGG